MVNLFIFIIFLQLTVGILKRSYYFFSLSSQLIFFYYLKPF